MKKLPVVFAGVIGAAGGFLSGCATVGHTVPAPSPDPARLTCHYDDVGHRICENIRRQPPAEERCSDRQLEAERARIVRSSEEVTSLMNEYGSIRRMPVDVARGAVRNLCLSDFTVRFGSIAGNNPAALMVDCMNRNTRTLSCGTIDSYEGLRNSTPIRGFSYSVPQNH